MEKGGAGMHNAFGKCTCVLAESPALRRSTQTGHTDRSTQTGHTDRSHRQVAQADHTDRSHRQVTQTGRTPSAS